MEHSDKLPGWVPSTLRELLAVQAASSGDGPIHSCVCLPEPVLGLLERTVRELYENPISLTINERSVAPTLDDNFAFDDGRPDALIIKSTVPVESLAFEHLEEVLPELEYDQFGGTPKFPATAPVLFLVTPAYGTFDPYLSEFEQIPADPVVLSRFQFTFPFADAPERAFDDALSSTLLGGDSDDMDSLRTELTAVRETDAPASISDTARRYIREYYVEKRQSESDAGVPITPRQVEAILALATTEARRRSSDVVTIEDAEYAVALAERVMSPTPEMTVELSQPESGEYSFAATQGAIVGIVRSLCNNGDATDNSPYVERGTILDEAESRGYDRETAKAALLCLRAEGRIIETSPDQYTLED